MICRKCHQNVPDAPYCSLCGCKQEIKKPSHDNQRRRIRGNGQGTVIKRGKTYTAIYNAATYHDGEKLIRKRVSKGGFTTRKDALAYIPTLAARTSGAGAVNQDMTLEELYTMWKAQHENDVSKSTMNCYKAAWKYYANIKYYKVKNIKTASLQECIDTCGQGRRTQENMKALGTMMFRMAMSNDLADKNYAEGLIARGERQEPREPFTDVELQKMWNIVNSKKYDYLTNHIDLILILCYTGFRAEEFLSLKREAYHEEADWSYFVGGSKTEAGKNRVVGISPKILPLVKRHLQDGYIFSKSGKKMDVKTFREDVYYPALDAAGIQRKVPHCCRHTFATLMKGIDVADKDKMAFIGHASMAQTMEYTHANLDGLKKITANL